MNTVQSFFRYLFRFLDIFYNIVSTIIFIFHDFRYLSGEYFAGERIRFPFYLSPYFKLVIKKEFYFLLKREEGLDYLDITNLHYFHS